jgi:outer membrane protein OmpA-like peptidoglycan-associated protein
MMQNAANSWRRWAAVACFAVLAACASPKPAPPPEAYHVAFATDSYTIDAAGQQVIDNVANAAASQSAARITLVGRTDAAGSPAFNMQLSQKRATAVHDALIATGKIAPDKIETSWAAEKKQPAASGAAEAPGDRAVDIFIH